MAKRRATISPVQTVGRRSGRTTAVAGDSRYNMSYHPADKVLRPANARRALGTIISDEISESDKENMPELDTEAESDHVVHIKRLKQPLYSMPVPDPRATRRSKRSEAHKPVLYNAKVHPLDVHCRKSRTVTESSISNGHSAVPNSPTEQVQMQDNTPSDEESDKEGIDTQEDANVSDSETASNPELGSEHSSDQDNLESEIEQDLAVQYPSTSKSFAAPPIGSSLKSSRHSASSSISSKERDSSKTSNGATTGFMSDDSGPDEIPSQIMPSNPPGWRPDSHVAISKSDPRLQGFRTVDDSILEEHAESIELASQFLHGETDRLPQGSVEY